MFLVECVFWCSLGLIAYAYLGYPLLLALWDRFHPRPRSAASELARDWPQVSLIIAAYKEETVILQRVQNALQMDYPADRLEILIGCDGQEDATAELVRTVDDPRVKLLAFPQRRGKPSVLNDCVAAARGELLSFSDANTFWERGALKTLVRRFQDTCIGGVCGELRLTDAATGRNVDGLYWRYENFLKHCEGRLGMLLGFNGAIYAIRRELWRPIPAATIVDDFLIGMRIHQQGRGLAFEPGAVADEETAPTIGAEFHRRARIGAGGFQSLCWLSDLLRPRAGRVAWAFWSHKVLRWFCPLLMGLALASNAALVASPVYRTLLAAQIGFYLLAWLGMGWSAKHPPAKVARLASMFVGMNAALAVGLWRWVRGRQSGAWKRTERTSLAPLRETTVAS